MTKCRNFQSRAPGINRTTREGWIVWKLYVCIVLLPPPNAERGLCHSVSSYFVGIRTTPAEDSCYQNEAQERKSRRAPEQLAGLSPHLSINKWLHSKFFLNHNPPCQRSEVAPNEHRYPMAPPFPINTWLQIRIKFTSVSRCHSHTGLLNHLSGVEFSSATRLGAFLISLKGAQVISCRRLNPLHLLQLYWQLPQQKKGSLAGSSALHF